jgi:hypothetical protein
MDVQISTANDTQTLPSIPKKHSKVTKNELRAALEAGVERSVSDLVKSGHAVEDAAREAAAVLKDGFQTILASELGDADSIDLSELMSGVSSQLDTITATIADTPAATAPASAPASAAPAATDDDSTIPDFINLAAFQQAVNVLQSVFLNGPASYTDFFSVFVQHRTAQISCATCDQQITLLAAAFLTNRNGKCATCLRPRCVRCSASTPADVRCKRCAGRKGKK